ncbi:MAG: site-2 protease family protein [Halomonas sp.]|jgi:Zn-dependent protease|uniref:Zinc metalloprotease n=1 Tax=Billgrantia tianxiuensis TaxID=2497861 RepID=A0A6I6SQH2_9GAMM|nr:MULTISPECIES: site-2 protease family protein [Halomonas]MCE8032240.1 site-2 protease family protein [Halomonas sp. MCCC 1A11057]MDX5434523.1 site-2 protease family protein [Halomonas sp.]QHC49755.1 site-2 protease family protein [Halomonas tianxiuensis]
MFKSVLVLGHFRGIRLEVHISWLIIFALLLTTMSAGFQNQYPDWSITTAVLTALVTALLFFSSIVAHELGHSLVAIRRGVPVTAITLFIFGGVAQMTRDPDKADDEFWIAIAGPIVSFVLAAGFALLAAMTSGWHEPVPVALGWLATINLVVAIFNLIPGFPLDGGRVLRALVWKWTGDSRKSNEMAFASGKLVAYGLFGLAIWNMAAGNLVGGLWIMLIAWFLLNMTQAQGRMHMLRERLAGVRARDLAETDIPLVDAQRSIEAWLYQDVLPSGRRAFLIGTDTAHVVGLVSLSDTRRVEQAQWPITRVADIMTPVEKLYHVAPGAKADEVLQLLNEHGLNQIPVMENGRVSGWIDRQRLLRTVELHLEVKR